MTSHSREYPVAVSRDEADVLEQAPLAEAPIAWEAFALLMVTAFSSYVF